MQDIIQSSHKSQSDILKQEKQYSPHFLKICFTRFTLMLFVLITLLTLILVLLPLLGRHTNDTSPEMIHTKSLMKQTMQNRILQERVVNKIKNQYDDSFKKSFFDKNPSYSNSNQLRSIIFETIDNGKISHKQKMKVQIKQTKTQFQGYISNNVDILSNDSSTYVISNTKLTRFNLNSTLVKTLILKNNTQLVNMTECYLPNLNRLVIDSTPLKLFDNNIFGKIQIFELINSQLLDRMIQKVGFKIKELALIGNNISKITFDSLQYLTNLTIKNNSITDLVLKKQSLNFIQLNLENLNRLIIQGPSIKSLSSLFLPKLTYLEVTFTLLQTFNYLALNSLEELVLSNNKLISLNISSFSSLQWLFVSEPLLKDLSINNCSSLISTNVNSPALIHLNLQRLILLKSFNINASNLQQLKINTISQISWQIIDKYKQLISLEIVGTILKNQSKQIFKKLQNIQIKYVKINQQSFILLAPSLLNLKLSYVNLTSLNVTEFSNATFQFNLPSLQQFYALNNIKLDQIAFDSILIYSPFLKKLEIAGTSISNFTVKYSSLLEYINIGKGSISYFQSQLKNLSYLKINNNPISNMEIRNSTLINLEIWIENIGFQKLNISNCQTRDFLYFRVPNLQSLYIHNVNFSNSQPIKTGFDYLKLLQIKYSNIQKFSKKNFPALSNFSFQQCDNIILETHQENVK